MCTLRNLSSAFSSRTQRRKVWELEDRYHCSLVGTCLSLSELRKLARRMGLSHDVIHDDYILHIHFVGLIGQKTTASRLINKHLERKYQKTIKLFSQLSDDQEILQHWNAALKDGEIGAAYWSIITHPKASADLLFDCYGKVHMLSHLSGATVRVNMRELHILKQKLPALEKQSKASIHRLQSSLEQKRNNILQLSNEAEELRKTVADCNVLIKESAQQKQGKDLLALRKQSEQYAAKLAVSRARAEQAEADSEQLKIDQLNLAQKQIQLKSEFKQVNAERHALESTLMDLLKPEYGQCENQCDNSDLCQRNILYVGGRSRQCVHFKKLVEKRNGRFIHHDGGLEESQHRLGQLLSKADAVFCPLDCISHEAMCHIKRDCKRYGTQLEFLAQSSLSAFAHKLHSVIN